MLASTFPGHSTRRSPVIALVGGCLIAVCPALAGDEPGGRDKLPEGPTKITSQHLVSKVPNFFTFDYPFQPKPGKRLWLRVDDMQWVERFPDGSQTLFKILGHTKVREMEGTVVMRIEGEPEKPVAANGGGFQVFIPDKGNDEMAILFKDAVQGRAEWLDMSWSLKKSTIIQDVQ